MNAFIYVDKDGSHISVYCSEELDYSGFEPADFWLNDYANRHAWEDAAISYAKRTARQFKAEWGTNW